MRVVAIEAVLAHWDVLIEERAALLCMAAVAVVIHRRLSNQLFGRTAVRIMAIRARDFSFPNWHMRGILDLRAL